MKRRILIGVTLFICFFLLSARAAISQDICEGDFDCDGDCDGSDASLFKSDFGRNLLQNPCPACEDDLCPSGMVDCGGTCIDPMKDSEYCGAGEDCLNGTECGNGEICSNGVCEINCPPTQMKCDGMCVDTNTDESNCGSCGNVCQEEHICIGGICTFSCPTNLTNCSGTCVDTNTDENYCGSCNNSCGSGEMCIAGVCVAGGPTCEGTLSPMGRWCDQGNGTVQDMTTGLVWLKDAGWGASKLWIDCTTYDDAHTRATSLHTGMEGAGLSDGSTTAQWRLPTWSELEEITGGNEYIRSSQMYFFTGVRSDFYWSSTTYYYDTIYAWGAYLGGGLIAYRNKGGPLKGYVWPVRGGQ